jgi:hypothetical protein
VKPRGARLRAVVRRTYPKGWVVAVALALGAAGAAHAAIQTTPPQLLPMPVTAPPAPEPIPPPINPGYAADPSDGISPLLTTPGPLYQFPQPGPQPFPPPPLPGPIDQQKLQAYRNDLRAQQWQLQSQGSSLGSTLRGRLILQQLNAPDPQ